MERKVISDLDLWKNSENRKPILITGLHGIGKTETISQFGKEYYEDYAYFNLRYQKELLKIIDKENNVDKLINMLSLVSGVEIKKNKTLLIFDDVDAYPNILIFLNRVSTTYNDYHVISIASSVPNMTKSTSFVGNIIFKKMYPLDFEEFLLELGKEELVKYIYDSYQNGKKMPFHDYAVELFNHYLFTGGMPKLIDNYQKELKYQNSISNEVIGNLFLSKKKLDSTKLIALFNAIPYQLLKKNKKFKYTLINKGARKTEYVVARDVLKKYDIIIEAYKISKFDKIIGVKNKDDFKIYMMDNSLLSNKYLINSNNISKQYKEALLENYVADELVRKGYGLFYYESDGIAEIPFLIQNRSGEIFPIEIEKKLKSKNLNALSKKVDFKYSINLTNDNFKYKNNIKNIPLYALFCLEVK